MRMLTRVSGASERQLFWALVGLAALVRVALFGYFAATDSFFAEGIARDGFSVLYRQALGPHFWEYLVYEHTVPPLFTVRNALIEALLPPGDAGAALFVLLAVLGCLGAGLGYALARLAGLNRGLAVLVGVLVTGRWVLWELFRFGKGWDSENPFLVLLFAVLLLGYLRTNRRGLAWWSGIGGALLLFNYNFGAPIVFPAVLAAIFIQLLRRSRPVRAVALLVFPLVSVAAVVVKNGIEHDLWALSSGVGQNVMQAYNSVLKDPAGRGRGSYLLARRAGGYPDWWFWCYEEAERNRVHHVPNVAGFYGMCNARLRGGYTFDYSSVRAYFADHPDPRMEAVVAKDVGILASRPWLWSGPIVVRVTGLSIEYGRISRRVMGDTLILRPFYFIRRIHRTLLSHWVRSGAEFLVLSNRTRFAEPRALLGLNLIGYLLFFAGFGLAVFHFFRSGWRLLRRLRRPDLDAIVAGTGVPALMLSVCIVPAMAASVLVACCENYRHAFVFFPLLMVLALEMLWRRSFWSGLAAAVRRLAAVASRLAGGRFARRS